MNTVEALRKFKAILEDKLGRKTGWGKNELKQEIERAYNEILEMLISPDKLA